MAFHAKLRELREAANLTQTDLAERSGIPKASIANLEQDRRRPSLETAQKLALALGVSCEAFNEPAESDEKRERGRPRKPAPDAAPASEPAPSKPATGKPRNRRPK